MPNNYILLERIELNASAASVSFTNIPQSGYTDLKIVVSARTNRASTWDFINVTLNGSSSSYSYRYLAGNGASASSGTLTSLYGGDIPAASATASTFCNTEIYIPNYASTTTAKSVSFDTSGENNATTAYLYLGAGLWNPGTQAGVTSITIAEGNLDGSFVQYSTFSLYGLAAVGTTPVIAPKASGGNITTDGTYWIHTFNSSGYFVPQVGLTCDALVVAGGGGGGSDNGGGGGAGGFRTGTGLAVTASSYTITVGAGGAGGYNGATGAVGNNSIFSTITSNGGGLGGGNGGAGGSGGGGAVETSGNLRTGGAGNTPSTSPSQGNNGGAGGNYSASQSGSGGGGGASAAGTAGAQNGGAGGAGTANSYSGTSVTYAGGGGGGSDYRQSGTAGAGGAGGGGNGGRSVGSATSGTANTGGGGGGQGYGGSAGTGGTGGSGVVIIRYPIA